MADEPSIDCQVCREHGWAHGTSIPASTAEALEIIFAHLAAIPEPEQTRRRRQLAQMLMADAS